MGEWLLSREGRCDRSLAWLWTFSETLNVDRVWSPAQGARELSPKKSQAEPCCSLGARDRPSPRHALVAERKVS